MRIARTAFPLRLLLGIALGCTVIGADDEERRQAQEDAEVTAPKFRRADVQIVNESGKPVPGAKVRLFGIERFNRLPGDVENKPFSADSVWDFVTDESGRFTALFGKFNARRYWEKTGIGFPGSGEFYFVADMEGYAGGVSRRIRNWEEELNDLDW